MVKLNFVMFGFKKVFQTFIILHQMCNNVSNLHIIIIATKLVVF